MDPPFGLKVAPWDEAALSPTEFQAILKSVCFVNGQNNFHILCFCEFSMYGEYVKADLKKTFMFGSLDLNT